MHALVLFISIAILFTGAIIQRQKANEPENILGEESNITIEPTPTNTPTPIPTTVQSTPRKDSGQTQTMNTFQYPNTTVKSSDSNSLILESGDDPDTVTAWYKEKITSAGMNAKSFVSTKTNGNVKNVLVGANGEIEIRVVITQKAGDATVQIVVTIQTS